MVIGLDFAGRPSREERAAVSARIREELARYPGVTHASETISVPFWIRLSTRIRLPGRDSLPRLRSGYPSYNGVTPEFFATTGIDIVQGRGFDARDQAGAAFVMVVNQTMARTIWPAGDAIGSCVLIGSDSAPPCVEVVGVAEDSRRDELREEPIMQYYVPLAQSAALGMSHDRSLFLRTASSSAALQEPVRRAVLASAPELLWAEVRPMDQLLEPQIQPWRLGAAMFTLFGVLALVVAAVGLYGVLAYSVATRAREFGVRGALGASGGTLVRQIVLEGVRLTALGLAIGAAGALGGARLVAGLLFDTSPQDPTVLAGVALVLMAMAVAASLVPAIRAARVSPAEALRGE
jgi:predicted permease